VRWFPLAEAERLLTYSNEAELVRQAEALIAQGQAAGRREDDP
jgi:hypothetical protein